MTMKSLLCQTSLVLRTQSFSAVFCPAVFFYISQLLKTPMLVTRKENKFNKQTRINVRH